MVALHGRGAEDDGEVYTDLANGELRRWTSPTGNSTDGVLQTNVSILHVLCLDGVFTTNDANAYVLECLKI